MRSFIIFSFYRKAMIHDRSFMANCQQSYYASPASHLSSKREPSLRGRPSFQSKETPIQSLSDFTLEILCIARNHLPRIASYLRRMSTTLCIKIHMKSDPVIESAFPYIYAFLYFFTKRAMRLSASAIFSRLAA